MSQLCNDYAWKFCPNLQYEDPSKEAQNGIIASRKRIAEVKKEMKRCVIPSYSMLLPMLCYPSHFEIKC